MMKILDNNKYKTVLFRNSFKHMDSTLKLILNTYSTILNRQNKYHCIL